MIRTNLKHSSILWRSATLIFLVMAMSFSACGEKRPNSKKSSSKRGRVDAAFASASKKYKIPARFMMATAYLESRLSPENALAHYVDPNDPANAVLRGTVMTQTAFGLTFDQLGLDPLKEESHTLEAQIDAYGNWLHTNSSDSTYLTSSPKTLDEKYFWIDTLAKLHRAGEIGRRNVQILFAKELIQILNEGFIWQDSRNGQVLKVAKESPSINVSNFEQDIQKWFELDTPAGVSELPTATYLTLATIPPGDLKNKPKRVVVIHCPLTLSACLELQNSKEDTDEYVHLETHYVIPPIYNNTDIDFARVYQVAKHDNARIITNSRGEHLPVEDAIVVMLVGNSGRIVEGERYPAKPTWFTDKQLRRMGQMINDICTYLSSHNGVDRNKCLSTEGNLGVQFHSRGYSEEYRWGDIADFDPSIFQAYLASAGGLGTEVAFEFKGNRKEFKAGQIPLKILFNPIVTNVELERLSRCRDGRVVWERVETEEVRGQRKIQFKKAIYDSGPNRNGEQFFRARVFDKNAQLVGWSIDQIYLRKFEEGERFAPSGACL
jgi:hypothetical protein